MAKSNLNAFDDWAETNKIFVRVNDPRGVADAYSTWWQATTGKQLTALAEPNTPFHGRAWRKGTVAPAHSGFVTLIMEAALLSRAQVLELAQHVSRTLGTLVVAVPRAAEEATFGYAIYEGGQMAFGQDGVDVYGEMQVQTHHEEWLASINLTPRHGGAAAWMFEDISEAISLRMWEINPTDKYTYYAMDEQP